MEAEERQCVTRWTFKFWRTMTTDIDCNIITKLIGIIWQQTPVSGDLCQESVFNLETLGLGR